MTDEVKERIKFNVEIIKILVLLCVGSTSGVISLILQGVTLGKQVVMTAGGMIIAIVSGITAINTFRETKRLLK